MIVSKLQKVARFDTGNLLRTNNSLLANHGPLQPRSNNSQRNPPTVQKVWFNWLKTTRNKEYEKGIIPIGIYNDRFRDRSFESCLINTKSAKDSLKITEINSNSHYFQKSIEKNDENALFVKEYAKKAKIPLSQRNIAIATNPKWITEYSYTNIDTSTGEILGCDKLQSNSFKHSNAKKIRAMDAFSATYSDLYRQRRVTLLFHTLTRANASNRAWSDFMDLVLKRYKRLGLPVLGYVWVMEVGEEDNMIHYHLAVAINRTRFYSIPKELKFEEVWGSRTEIDFVKKNVRHYLAKYFAKNQSRVVDLDSQKSIRSLGKSKEFKKP